MKTIKQAKKEAPQLSKLIDAVIEQIDEGDEDYALETLDGLRNANDGHSGFIYYSDTHEFATKNQVEIVKLLEDTADQLCEDVLSMVKNFGVFRGEMDKDELKDLYKYLSGVKPEQGAVTNVMAWFALEQVARIFND